LFLSEKAASAGIRPTEAEMQGIVERGLSRLNDPAYQIDLSRLK